jgi:cytochrome c oxidase subunit 2
MISKLLGLIDNASEHGFQIDQMIEFVHWLMLALAAGWGAFFIYTLFRFHRSRNPKANYHGVTSHASSHLEMVVVLIEAVLLLGFAIPIWAKRVNGPRPTENYERVRVIGQQFLWNFHYAGADGIFGRQKAELVSSSNPLGLDPTDPAAADDLVVKNEMHIPRNKNVILDITSKDVIHSFSLHAMRIGQDAIPGNTSPIWFRPIKAGTYEVVCAQLCGIGHYAMRGVVVVDTPEDYTQWLKDMQALKASSAPAANPAAK